MFLRLKMFPYVHLLILPHFVVNCLSVPSLDNHTESPHGLTATDKEKKNLTKEENQNSPHRI